MRLTCWSGGHPDQQLPKIPAREQPVKRLNRVLKPLHNIFSVFYRPIPYPLAYVTKKIRLPVSMVGNDEPAERKSSI